MSQSGQHDSRYLVKPLPCCDSANWHVEMLCLVSGQNLSVSAGADGQGRSFPYLSAALVPPRRTVSSLPTENDAQPYSLSTRGLPILCILRSYIAWEGPVASLKLPSLAVPSTAFEDLV